LARLPRCRPQSPPSPDTNRILITDVVIGERYALEVLADCVKSSPDLAVALLSEHAGPSVVRAALALGAARGGAQRRPE
jgi:DNA-binding NarL/FixJ family response regulator